MKILILTTFTNPYSGTSCMWRLVDGLKELNFNCSIVSEILSEFRQIDTPKFKNKWAQKTDKIYSLLSYKFFPNYFRPIYPNYYNIIKKLDPDIINIHWTHGNKMIPLEILYNLTKLKPIVWTIHDMYPFTGGCHYSYDCNRYKDGCYNCPQIENKLLDFTNLSWKKKQETYNKIKNLQLVTPSKWMQDCISQSILKNIPVKTIPYGLDTDKYKPFKNYSIREIFNITQNDDVILFFGKNKRKGDDLIVECIIQYLRQYNKTNINNLHLINCGKLINLPSEIINNKKIITHKIGRVINENLLISLYNISDILLLPTRADNLPSTVIESISCGTPVVTTNIGGIPDMIIDNLNGLVVQSNSSKELASAINQCFQDKTKLAEMGKAARLYAINNYSMSIQAGKYSKLFSELIT